MLNYSSELEKLSEGGGSRSSTMDLLSCIWIEMDFIWLERYYSSQLYLDNLYNKEVSILSKKNATLNGSQKWKDTIKHFIENTTSYLEEYQKRSNSEFDLPWTRRSVGKYGREKG